MRLITSSFRLNHCRVGHIVRRALLMIVFLSMTGCAASGRARVEYADSVDTGKRRYDAYFEAVIELRDEVSELNSDLFPVREPLVETLELDVDVALATLVDKVRAQVAKQRDYGVLLNLRLMPRPRLVVDRGTFEATESDERLVRSIEESANRALSTYKKYRKLLSMVQRLGKRRGILANRLDDLEAGYPKRDLIERELVASGRVLRSAEKKLFGDTRTLSFFMIALADATDTGAATKFDEKCEAALSNPRPKRRSRRRGRRKPTKRRPPPRGDDFSM
ncbi:MAG: hypothetical protein VB934_08380 [Polyangiaceae bacterium]